MPMSNQANIMRGWIMKLAKTIATVAATLSLLFPLAACGGNSTTTEPDRAETNAEELASEPESSEPQAVESTQAEEENILFSDAEWPENEVTALVPKPEFSAPIESVSTNDSDTVRSVNAQWTGVTQSEVAEYVQALKDAGFTFEASETSSDTMYSYRAQNADLTASIESRSSYAVADVSLMRVLTSSVAITSEEDQGASAEPEYEYHLRLDLTLNILQ